MLYAGFGMVCLKITKIPINILTVGGFVVFGALAGIISVIVYGAFIVEEQKHLGDEVQNLGLFAVSTVIALAVSFGAAKLISKNTND